MFSTLYCLLPKYFNSLEVYGRSDFPDSDYGRHLILTIVRNPLSRLVSLYFDKCIKHPATNRDENLQPCQRQILEALGVIRGVEISISCPAAIHPSAENSRPSNRADLRMLQTISFSEFLEVAQAILTRSDADPHFKPQTAFLFKDGRPRFDRAYQLEDIDCCWPEICSLLGTDMELIQENATEHDDPITYYTEVECRLLWEMYRDDFVNFGYSCPCSG